MPEESTPEEAEESKFVHRAWGRSRPDEDVIDVYVTRYERNVTDGSADRAYGLFDPDEGIIWCAFLPTDLIRPFLSINGLVAAVALETVDLHFLQQLTHFARSVDAVAGALTYVKP